MPMPVITVPDEQLHAPGPDPHWQESYYFNWADLQGKAFGLARIGYDVARRRADAAVLTMRGGRRELVYAALNQPISGDPLEINATDGLRVGRLTLTMDVPLQQWRITLTGREELDLTWRALAPPLDFGHEGSGVAQHHFEHPGSVAGRMRVRGEEHAVAGFGTRDKSWGPRDWGTISGWDWISAQFGPDFAFTATQAMVSGQTLQAGFVYYGGDTRALGSFDLSYDCDRDHVARGAQLLLHDADGLTHAVSARGLAQVPLFKRGLMIQETHASFTTTLDGRQLPGAGVLEHAWHAGARGALLRLPDLLPVMKDALVASFS